MFLPYAFYISVSILIIHFRFDLKNSNVNDENLDKMAADKIPDVVLVKKVYAEKALRNRKRKWKLKFLNEELHREKGNCQHLFFLNAPIFAFKKTQRYYLCL